MVLHKKDENPRQHNILGYEYIYKSDDHYVMISVEDDIIDMISVQYKDDCNDTTNAEVDETLDECYTVIGYGKYEFRIGKGIDI